MIARMLSAYLPTDRCHALVHGLVLPEHTAGAALFADISGFTPLTEALARELGDRRGSEELTRQLNRVYGALVAEVDRFSGSVISFSGDAITCWFDNRDGDLIAQTVGDQAPAPQVQPLRLTALRAVACALAMQSVMRQFETITTPGGSHVALAIKVGVAAGPVRRFVLGDPQIQRIDALAGATMERLAAAEHAADKGEVVIGEDVAALAGDLLLLDHWHIDADGARFATVTGLHTPPPERPWPAVPDELLLEDVLRPWLLSPVYTRLRAGQEQFLAELRPVAVLFARFGGIDYDTDPEAGSKLDRFLRRVQQEIAHYDGSLLQLTIGDKGSYFYCSFGAPLAHEDDAVRACRAALAIHAAASELHVVQDLQIGMTLGRVWAGAYGGATRRTYGVLGDDVNLAARLMQAAPPGGSFASARLRRMAGEAFAWSEPLSIRVKGKSELISVSNLERIRERMPLHFQSLAAGLPLVGRMAELRVIGEQLDQITGGIGRVVGITAEAGLGKSRLVREAVRSALEQQIQVFAGECQSYSVNDSYFVWEHIWESFFHLDRTQPVEVQIKALERAVAALDPLLLPRLPLLGRVVNLAIPDNDLTASLSVELRKTSLEALLVSCVREYARLNGPFMIVLEDAHWLDPLSHDLLETIVRAISDVPVLVMLAFRPVDQQSTTPRIAGLPGVTILALSELSAPEAAELVVLKQVHLDMEQQLSEDAVQWIVERTQGNPFYIEELLNYLHDRGVLAQSADDLERLDLPTSLASLILSRIDQLNERQKTTLKVASIVGRTFRATWLWGFYPPLGSPNEVRGDLEELHSLELTAIEQPEPVTTYLFKHILTHGVAYESLPFETRAWLHGQLAIYIEHSYSDMLDQFVDLLAYHYDLSPNQSKRREYLQRAGEAAQDAYANTAAIGYYRRVLPLIPEPEQGAVRFRLGQVLELVGEWDDADHEYRRALELAEQAADAPLVEAAYYAIGSLYRKQGQYVVALEWLEQAREASRRAGDTAAMVQAITEMGEVFRFQGDFAAAGSRYAESLSLSAAHDQDTTLRAARAGALKGAGTLAAQQGDLETARRLYEESLELLRALGDRPGVAALLNNLSIVARFQGDLAASRRLNEESLLQFRQVGDRWKIAQSLNNLGNVIRDSGDYEHARRVLEESLKVSRRLGSRWGIANTLSSLTNLLLRIGERDNVGELLDESLALNRELGDRNAIAYCLEDYAGLAAGEGQAERALRLAGAASALRESIGAPLPPAEQAALDSLLAPARTLLTDDATAWENGRTTSLDDAIALALAKSL